MKKIFTMLMAMMVSVVMFGQAEYANTDTTKTYELDATSVVSFFRNSVNVGSLVKGEDIIEKNYGQEPSHIFNSMPSIFSMTDNGTEFGYGYYRIRGLDQTRINVTLDGMPWNEAEDFGSYFANSPDLLSSMHSVKVEKGTSANNTGTAGTAGGINLESIDLIRDTVSYAYVGAGSYETFKTTVVYNSGLINGHWGIHTKATMQSTEGYRDYAFNRSQAFTVKAGYFFNERHSIDFLSMNGQHRNGQAWLGNTMEEINTNPRCNGNTVYEPDLWIQSVNKIQYKGWLNDNILLTASTYLQFQTGDYAFDLDNYMRRMDDPAFPTTGIVYDYGLTHYLYGGNIMGKFYLNNWTLTAGTNIYHFQRRHFMDDSLLKNMYNVPVEEYYDNIGHKNDVEVFANALYHIGKFSVSGNIQYRYVDFNYKDNLNSSIIYDKKAMGTVWNFTNCGMNMEYEFNRANKTYLRYGLSHREPTRTDMFGGNEYFSGEITSAVPEVANDIELGHVLTTDKVDFNANAFIMLFKNERVLNGEFGLNGLPCHESAKESIRTGVEMTLDYQPITGFHTILNGSYSFNQVKSETYGTKRHILTPAVTLDFDINYSRKGFLAGFNTNYHSKMFVDMGNDFTLPDFLTLNLYGSYRIKDVEIGARLNNFTNRRNFNNGAVGAGNTMLYFPTAGINGLVNLKYFF